jgi:hypothetical protein
MILSSSGMQGQSYCPKHPASLMTRSVFSGYVTTAVRRQYFQFEQAISYIELQFSGHEQTFSPGLICRKPVSILADIGWHQQRDQNSIGVFHHAATLD